MKTNITISVDVESLFLFKNKYFYTLSPFLNQCIKKAVNSETFAKQILKEIQNEKTK